jgi:hypothetical protein
MQAIVTNELLATIDEEIEKTTANEASADMRRWIRRR